MESQSMRRAQLREELGKLGLELGKAQKKIAKQEGVIAALRKSEKHFRSLMDVASTFATVEVIRPGLNCTLI